MGQFQRGEVMPLDEVVLDGVLTGTDGWASQLCPTRGQGWPYILPQMPMSMSSRWGWYSTVHEVVVRPSQSKCTAYRVLLPVQDLPRSSCEVELDACEDASVRWGFCPG